MNKSECIDFIQEYHYSKVMPRLTKEFLGFYFEGELVGVVTLGWGTQPLQTIKKLFPNENMVTGNYYEIGKMCFRPEFNENKSTGSQIISLLRKWMQENTDCMFLYTLADGIVGKVGYVYQASNFLFGGHFWTDVYIGPDGEKIHPRSAKSLLKENAEFLGKDKLFWLTPDFTKTRGIRRIRGKMFRYMLPMNKKCRKILIRHGWNTNYPKNNDLEWKEQIEKGKYTLLDEMPKFVLSCVNINEKNVNAHKKGTI